MTRIGDVGPYAIGNVEIKTNSENVREFDWSKRNTWKGGRGRRKEHVSTI